MSAADTEARRRIREDLDTSLFVEAAAGTGKTSELIRRVIGSIAQGKAKMDQTVIVTFTRKAAGEIKLRLRQSLELARLEANEPEQRGRLEQAIASLEDARVGTIHSFAGNLLRERPVEARLDPEFVSLEEHEARALFRRVFGEWFERRLGDASPGLQRALSRSAPRFGPRRSPKDRLIEAAWLISSFRDFDARWPRPAFDREAQADRILAATEVLCERLDRAGKPRDPLTRSIDPLRRVLEWARGGEREGALDRDVLEGLLVEARGDLRFARDKKGRGAFLGDDASARVDVVSERDRLLDALDEFVARADVDLASQLRDELFEVSLAYERKKSQLGKLDFTDLLLRARELLREHPAVRASFQSRWTRLYVDELQDTDPLQMEILLLLSADDPRESDWTRVRPRAGKLFMVGDPKQSIYGFRRADLSLYHAVKRRLLDRGVESVSLSVSFRATKAIQTFINHCFEAAMVEDPERGQPGYVPLEGGPPTDNDQPSVVALPVPDPEGTHRQGRMKVAKVLPDLVSAWVHWLLTESRWTVRSPVNPSQWEPVKPHHVALLFRRYSEGARDVTAPYLRALEARGLPHVVVGARAFHDEEEIEVLRAAAIAIEWPEDELAVFATLRGSLFAIEDGPLLHYRLGVGELQPLSPPKENLPPELHPIRDALALLGALHERRNRRPIIETLTELLERTRAHAGFALRPSGPRVLANVHRLLDLAAAFEKRGGLSFRGFVESLEEGAEHSTPVDAPVVEESAEGIRVITAHSAKGLEFPIVVLADLDGPASRRRPSRHLDPSGRLAALEIMGLSPQALVENTDRESARDAAEDLRLTYVAATRARDLLVIPAVDVGPFPSWYSALNRGLYPSGPVHPGLHELPGAGPVLWWDPARLASPAAPRSGLRAQDLLLPGSEGDAPAIAREKQRYEDWHARRAGAISSGGAPDLRPFTATGATALPEGEKIPMSVELVPRSPDRPAGPRFGTLVHAILRDLDLRQPTAALDRLATLHGRVLGATEAEVRAAAEAARRATEHPLLLAAGEAGYVERELPVRLYNPDGSMLEGEIDLVFASREDTLVVVDFKTDQDPSLRLEKYERQLAWYAAALRAAQPRPVRGVILVV